MLEKIKLKVLPKGYKDNQEKSDAKYYNRDKGTSLNDLDLVYTVSKGTDSYAKVDLVFEFDVTLITFTLIIKLQSYWSLREQLLNSISAIVSYVYACSIQKLKHSLIELYRFISRYLRYTPIHQIRWPCLRELYLCYRIQSIHKLSFIDQLHSS